MLGRITIVYVFVPPEIETFNPPDGMLFEIIMSIARIAMITCYSKTTRRASWPLPWKITWVDTYRFIIQQTSCRLGHLTRSWLFEPPDVIVIVLVGRRDHSQIEHDPRDSMESEFSMIACCRIHQSLNKDDQPAGIAIELMAIASITIITRLSKITRQPPAARGLIVLTIERKHETFVQVMAHLFHKCKIILASASGIK